MKPIIAMLHKNWLWALAIAFFFGCQDAAGPETQQVLIEVDPTISLVEPTYDDAGNFVPPDVTVDYGRILVSSTGLEQETYVGGSVDLSVILLNSEGSPVEGERIEFAIMDEDAGSGSLTSSRTRTAADGSAHMSFYAGEEVRDFTINAWNSASRTLTFTVHVVAMPTGSLSVGFEYTGPAALGSYEFYILQNPNWCDDPYYLNAPPDIIFSENLESLFERVETGPMLAGERVSLMVRGRLASNGVIAAGGCLGDVRIEENVNKRVTVNLFALTLNPSGAFDVTNHFDFSGAIPGTLGTVIQELVLFFGDDNHERQVATAIFDALSTVIRNFVSGLLATVIDAVADWIDDYLNDIINAYIDNDGPEWLRTFFTVGSDVISIVSNMEVLSTIRIAKPRSDGTFDGNQNWLGIALYWRLPCANDPDPECGRYAFSMDEIWQLMNDVQLVYGQFSGRIHSFNQGVIDTHTLDLQYGRLIIFVLNYIVIPWATGDENIHTIRNALLHFANCEGMARRITGDSGVLEIIGINIATSEQIQGWCTTVIGLVGDAATAIINRLRIDTHLTLQGTMTFIEEDSDLTVDRLEDGAWLGTIRTSEESGPAFQGDFSASSQGN